jgi:transposase
MICNHFEYISILITISNSKGRAYETALLLLNRRRMRGPERKLGEKEHQEERECNDY